MTTFIDYASVLGYVAFSKTKGLHDAIPIRKRYIANMAIYGTIKCFHSDNANELKGPEILKITDSLGIGVTTTGSTGNSNANNRVEGYNGRLHDRARGLLIQCGIPERHWPLAYLYSSLIENHSPTYIKRIDQVVIPIVYASRGRVIPDARIMRVFGCVVHGLIYPRHKRGGKVQPVAQSGIFMGYPRESPGGAIYMWVPNSTA